MLGRITAGLGVVLACAGGAAAQAPADTGAFIARLGVDTLAVERYVRTADRLEVQTITLTPRPVLRTHVYSLDEGRVVRLESTARPLEDANAPVTRQVVALEGDSAEITTWQAGQPQTRRVAVRPGTVPLAAGSAVAQLLAFQRAHGVAAGDSVVVPVLAGNNVVPFVFRRDGDGWAMRGLFNVTSRVTADAAGRLAELDGGAGSVVQRLETLDMDALSRHFVAREAAGRGLGQLSPLDTVRATVGGANLAVVYSRPALRGRRIFGEIEPYGQVWRTGANNATVLTTDRAIQIGGTTLEPGSYSIFTIPGPTEWTLIVNRQTGMSGLAHDPAQDVVRVPMRVTRPAQPVERFTITVEPQPPGGLLRLRWENADASVPFTVR
jgi:hypothetical protein